MIKKEFFRFEKRPDGKFDYHLLILVIVVHVVGLIGFYYLISGKCKLLTILWTLFMLILGNIGLTASAHRFFAHRSYKAVYGLKLFLLFCHQLTGTASIVFWVKVHRVHHQFTDTKKDPTNINRGIFFGYLSWLWLPPTPEAKLAMETVNLDDLFNDREVALQYKYCEILLIFVTILFPTLVPYLLFNESFNVAFTMNIFRILINFTQQNIGNSLLHFNGPKPYDKNLSATDSLIWIICTFGEGYHNFHHTFPFDYRGGEFINSKSFNVSAWFINLCAYFGWAYDLKTASEKMIEKRKQKTGEIN